MNINEAQQQNQQAMYQQMFQQQPKSTDPKTWTMGDYWDLRTHIYESVEKAVARGADLAIDRIVNGTIKWGLIILGLVFVCGGLIRIGMAIR